MLQCSTTSARLAQYAGTITIGAVVQQSGKLAATGRYYRDAYQIAVDTINQNGAVAIGEARYQLALKLIDNQSDSSLAAQHLADLVTKEKVHVLLGPYTSYDVLAAASVAEQYKVPMVQAGGASSRIFNRGHRYVFGTLPVGDEYFRNTIEMVRQLAPEARTVGMISGDDPFDITLPEATRALLQQAGLNLVLHQQYSERVPNFDNILTLMRIRAPDVLLWSGHKSAAIQFIRQAKRWNVGPKLLASYTAAVPTPESRSALGKDANHAFGMTPWLPNRAHKDRWFGDAVQFVEAFEERFGYAPDYHAAAAVAAVEALAMAIEQVGTLEPSQIRDAIAKLDFESLYGRIRFGDNGQIARPQTVIQIQGDQAVEIFTDELINQPIYPAAWEFRS